MLIGNLVEKHTNNSKWCEYLTLSIDLGLNFSSPLDYQQVLKQQYKLY